MNTLWTYWAAFVASAVTGIVFWLIQSGQQVFSLLSRGYFAYDAIVFLLIIEIVCLVFGLGVVVPIVQLVKRKKYYSFGSLLVLGQFVCLALVLFFTRQFFEPRIYLASIIAAGCGSLIFYKIDEMQKF